MIKVAGTYVVKVLDLVSDTLRELPFGNGERSLGSLSSIDGLTPRLISIPL